MKLVTQEENRQNPQPQTLEKTQTSDHSHLGTRPPQRTAAVAAARHDFLLRVRQLRLCSTVTAVRSHQPQDSTPSKPPSGGSSCECLRHCIWAFFLLFCLRFFITRIL